MDHGDLHHRRDAGIQNVAGRVFLEVRFVGGDLHVAARNQTLLDERIDDVARVDQRGGLALRGVGLRAGKEFDELGRLLGVRLGVMGPICCTTLVPLPVLLLLPLDNPAVTWLPCTPWPLVA